MQFLEARALNQENASGQFQIHHRRVYLCIGHRPPLFTLPAYVNLIQTADFNTDLPSFSVKQYLEEKKISPPSNYLADYAAILIHEKLLELEGRVDSVVTMLHRKICTTRALGQQAYNFRNNWLCPARKINIQTELELIKGDTLYAHPHNYPQGVMAAYARHHIIQDYLRLASLCLDKELLSTDDFIAMSKAKILFWAPGVGSLPFGGAVNLYGWSAQYIKAVHEAKYICKLPSDAYQKRAISFFAERFLSQKLMKWLLDAKKARIDQNENLILSKAEIGYFHTCTEDGESTTIVKPGICPDEEVIKEPNTDQPDHV